MIDFYDPESDEYLLCELVFRELFNLREKCADCQDANRESLLPNNALTILARRRPKTMKQLCEVLDEFDLASSVSSEGLTSKSMGPLLVKTISEAVESYPRVKDQLAQQSNAQGWPGELLAPTSSQNDRMKRKREKEERRLQQVSKAKYDDCRILDQSGQPVFVCDD